MPRQGQGIIKSLESTAPQEGAAAEEADELFEMANLFPRTTGLPMTVSVSLRGNARQDVRVKVNTTHGNHMSIANACDRNFEFCRPPPGTLAKPLIALQLETTPPIGRCTLRMVRCRSRC